MDDKVGYAWLCNERFAPSALPVVMVGYSGYAKFITRTCLVTVGYMRGYAAWCTPRCACTGYDSVTHGYMIPL